MDLITIGNDLKAYDVRDLYPDREPGFSKREPTKVKKIIIHHDAGSTLPEKVRQELELRRIGVSYRHHVSAQGWPGISYHLYVFPSGRVYYTGDWATVRYHTGGLDDPATPERVSRHNEQGLAIVLAGNFDRLPPTPKHLEALRHTVANVQFLFSSFLPVSGHQDEADAPQFATSCPGATWKQWKETVTVRPDSQKTETRSKKPDHL